MIKNLSVFFPCVNEEGNLEATVSKAVNILDSLKLEYEIIIVNDGSKDKTGQIAEKLAKENNNIKVITHPKNLGYGEALKSGFYNAKYDTIVYTDGDGQFDFSEVTNFISKLDEADLIIGYRIKRQDPLFRLIFAKGWALALFAFFRLKLRDVDCGFKMIKKQVLEKIPKLQSQRGAMINAELAIKTKKAGFSIAQVGVNHYPRLSGKPTGANIMVIIKSFLDLVKLWWQVKQGKSAFVFLILILILATFLRFYRLPEYMTFLGDEGRDALVIKSILVDHHIPLIGPPTSVGNIYLGPLYYYMMAVPMAIFWLNPVAAAGMNAVIGVLTVFLVYFLSKRWFGKGSGIIAAFLYAVSSVTILASRSSWNPNPAPLFAMLAIYSLYKAQKGGSLNWFALAGAFIGAAVQMHYLALILIPVCLAIYFSKKPYRFTGLLSAVLSFIFVMSPLILFDFRHNFLNYRAVTELFSGSGAVSVNIFETISKIPHIFYHDLIGRYIATENTFITIIVSFVIFIPFFVIRKFPILILGSWFFVGLTGLSFYQKDIYDHYLGFMNPVPFILLGAVFTSIKSFRYVFIALILFIGILNMQKNPLLLPPNNQFERTQIISKYVLQKSESRDFNFALLSKNNYDAAYQFYFYKFGYTPKQVPFDKTDQLFVVCEDAVCNPINNSKYEIAGFGWAKIAYEEQIQGVKLFKLIHNPSGKP